MENNLNNSQESKFKTKKKKTKLALIILLVILVLILGLQIYAATNGYGDVFSMIKDWTTTKNVTGQNDVFVNEEVETKETTNTTNSTKNNVSKNEQLEPDNYAEEVMKDEHNNNTQLEPDNYAEMVEIDDAYDKFLEKMPKTKTTKSTRIDIDNDGTHELIVAKGDFEAEKEVSFYTYKNGEVKDLGSLGFGHSALYKMNSENYLLQVYGQMGAEEVSKVFIKNGKIQKEKISEREIAPDEEYTEGDILLEELIY